MPEPKWMEDLRFPSSDRWVSRVTVTRLIHRYDEVVKENVILRNTIAAKDALIEAYLQDIARLEREIRLLKFARSSEGW